MYAPVQKLIDMHSMKRPNAADGMALAPTTFAPDWATPDGRSYLEGVMSLASAYFAVGALVFIAYAVLNCLGCCCRRRPAKPAAEPGACSRLCGCLFSPRGWFVAAVVVIAAVTAAAMSQMTAFRSTVRAQRAGVGTAGRRGRRGLAEGRGAPG